MLSKIVLDIHSWMAWSATDGGVFKLPAIPVFKIVVQNSQFC